MPSQAASGLRPLSPVFAAPEKFPGGSGGCGCAWSFLQKTRQWSLKFVNSACSYTGAEEGSHAMLAYKIAEARRS